MFGVNAAILKIKISSGRNIDKIMIKVFCYRLRKNV